MYFITQHRNFPIETNVWRENSWRTANNASSDTSRDNLSLINMFHQICLKGMNKKLI